MSDDHPRGQTPRPPQRLSRLEVLSAWLGLWKPRDVDVPPVPKGKLALAAAALVALLVVAVVVAVPAIQSGKDEAAEREGRDAAEARAAERRRLEAEQVAHRGRGDAGSHAGLLGSVRRSIEADARGRVRAGQFDGPIVRVDCEQGRRAGRRVSYDCTAVTREIPQTGRSVPGVTGYPFVAVVDFATGRYSWCKTNPVPGERVVPDPRDVVALPTECVL
jgi:hypothetical protein